MAGEALFQQIADAMQDVRGQVKDLRTYLIDLKNLVEAGTVNVTNFPAPAYPTEPSVSRAFGDLSASGDLVAAQGAGKNIRIVGATLSASAALSVRFDDNDGARSGTIRVGTAAPFVWPLNPHGWAQTGANKKLALTFVSGTGTLSYHVLWVAV